jgi:Spy/CpxP family protein refolding chaperone
MRMKQAMAVAVAVSAVAAGLLRAAEPPTREGRRGGRGPMEGVATYLGLTDEQKAQLAEQREKTRPQMQALFGKMRDNHERMRQALEAPAPDPATVGAIAIEGHNLQQQMKAQREAHEKALRTMLTPEQQTKLDALEALRKSGGGRMGPGRMGMGMGPRHFGPPPQDDMAGPGGPGGPGDEPPPQR